MDDESGVTGRFYTGKKDEQPKEGGGHLGNAISKIYGGAAKFGSSIVPTPDLWPDMDKVYKMVKVITYAGYALGVFGVMGSVYFGLRTTRELAQWRTLIKLRKYKKQ